MLVRDMCFHQYILHIDVDLTVLEHDGDRVKTATLPLSERQLSEAATWLIHLKLGSLGKMRYTLLDGAAPHRRKRPPLSSFACSEGGPYSSERNHTPYGRLCQICTPSDAMSVIVCPLPHRSTDNSPRIRD